MTCDPSWSIHRRTQNVCDTMDHRAVLLIQSFGSSWMASGRHLSGGDPNDPCFWSKSPKFFGLDRARRRSWSAGRSLHVSFDFFFLWIITYYYYYLASRRHSVMIQPHGSRWINLDHKTYFSTRFYDPNVTDNICPFNHGSSWIMGFFPCWVKGLWPMIQLDPWLQGHMLSYHTAALGIMIQLS